MKALYNIDCLFDRNVSEQWFDIKRHIFIPIHKQAGWDILNPINGLKRILQIKLIVYQWI